MTVNAADPRTALLAAPMSAYQKIGVAVTICLCLLDGFDVFAATFVAPAIKVGWHASQAQVGLVLSSGLLGMAAGSLLIAPAADVIGRRRIIFLSLTLMMAGDVWSSTAHNIQTLMVTRVFTGLGIGAMIAVISSLAAEYANARRRDFCLTLFGAGFPLGGMLGGLFAAYILPAYGWPSIFLTGAGLGLIMLLVVATLLPEPIAPIIARPKAGALGRVNAYLARCGMPPIAVLPAPPTDAGSAPLRALFAPGMAGSTVLITSIYFLHVMTLFFALSWAPSLIASEGFTPAMAASIALWINVGGIGGGLLLGSNTLRFGLKTLLIAAMCGGAVMTVVFGRIPANFLLLVVGSAALGFCLQSAMMGLYAAVARTFPAHVRATGTGLVIGLGRIGSAIGPALAGVLMTVGMSRANVAIAMAAPTLAGAVLLLRFRMRGADTP